MMRFKKFLCAILSFVCMICFGLGISLQTTNVAKAEEPTVTVAINQGANNVEWDATQKRVLLNVVDNATGAAASFTEWENITSVFGNGVTMNGTGANLNFFGNTGDGVSVIYPSTLEDGAVFSIAEGTVINGYVFPEFTLKLVNGQWIKQANSSELGTPSVALTSVDTEYNNSSWSGSATTMALGLMFDKNFTAKAYDGNEGGFDAPIISAVKAYTKINGQSGAIQLSLLVEENSKRLVFLYDNSLLTVPEGEEYTTLTIEEGAPFGGEYLPAITLYLVEGKWQATEPAPDPDPVTENVTVTNIHNRKGGDQRLLLFISKSDYDATTDVSAKIANTNVLDNVNVYTSETEYKTLREIYQGNAQAKIWGEANALGFQVDANYHGTAVYAVEIKAGAQFPATANSYTTYVVSETITYYNNDYQSTNAELNGWAVSWTAVKPAEPEAPVEPETPQLGTPDVTFVEIHNDNNNSVWDGSTRAIRLTFDKNFTAKAYAANEGGFDAMVIAALRNFTKINGQSLGNLTFLQIDNENSITFLYDESLLVVPEGQEYTTFTIEAGAPFGGRYLPAVTLYFNGKTWQATEPVPEPDPVTENVTITNIHNRKGSDQRLLIFISKSDYATNNTVVDLSSVNVLDNVNVYTSETEYKTLREIYQGNAQAKIWGEANALGFQVDANYHGTAVYAVEIKAGAQFPATTNSYTTYVVSETITYYNNDYQSTNTNANDWAVSWTTEKPVVPETPEQPDTPVEPEAPVEPGTPDVEFVEIYNDNNNSVWDGTTRALRLVFSENFTAKAYDGNNGGFDATVIAALRNFVKINGKSLGNLTFLQVDNENSITILYDESLLSVASGTKQTVFTIEEGAPFGGRYLPAVTLYFNGETWQAEAIDIDTKLLGIVATQNNTSWDATQNSVRLRFNYAFNNTENYNINDADGLNMLSKLTFNGVALTEADILIFTEDIAGNTVTMVYKKALFDMAKEEGMKYHTLALTESVTYLGVDIPAFTLYLRNDAWITEMLPIVEMENVETAVGYNTSNLIHIRDWDLDGDETTAVNNMIVFFLPSDGFPEEHNLFLNVDKVAEYNVFEKIKLHMITPNSVADADGFVTLSQVFNAGGWYPSNLSGGKDKIVVVNMWETVNSVAFSMGAEYTAESFDYIIIEEGCEFPNYYYTNKLNVDYVQNGESVDYEDLEKVSFWQTQTVKIYTNPADFQGPSLNTNWAVDTNMGEINVSGVDFVDGYVIIQLENSNYPTEADGDNLNQNIPAGNVPMALNMLADIYVNGISLYDRVVHFGANGITAYYNYKGYGNFAISVVLENENEVVTEIIIGKDLRIPLYGMSDMAAAAYNTMYKEVAATVSFSKGEQGFAQDEEIFWTVIFNDGENVKTVKVAHGEILAASDIPEVSVKEGYEFVAWVYGIDGVYTFAPTSNIASCYYLTARWKEVTEQPKDEQNSSEAGETTFGCFGAVSSMGTMASAMMLVGAYVLTKKKED